MSDPTADAPLQEALARQPTRSQWWDVWEQFRHHRGAMIGMVVFVSIILFVTLGPYVWTLDPGFNDYRARLEGPSMAHPLGTDQLGRDTLARLMTGGRISIAVGLTAMALALVLGTLVGVLSGFYRWLDGPLMRLTDLFLALPLLPLAARDGDAVPRAALGRLRPRDGDLPADRHRHRHHLVDAHGADRPRRRAGAQGARVRAGRALDRHLGSAKMVGRHILPNIMSPIMVSATLGIATAIITESVLSFLGLGFPPDFPTWGRLLQDANDRMTQNFELVFWPGLMISLTVLSVNYIGDGLRDALDPRLRGR